MRNLWHVWSPYRSFLQPTAAIGHLEFIIFWWPVVYREVLCILLISIAECLICRHDDSETDRDFFLFEATPMLTGELPETIEQVGNISYEGRLNISIELCKLVC